MGVTRAGTALAGAIMTWEAGPVTWALAADQFQAGVREAATGEGTQTFLNQGLQGAGMSEGAAGWTEAGIGVLAGGIGGLSRAAPAVQQRTIGSAMRAAARAAAQRRPSSAPMGWTSAAQYREAMLAVQDVTDRAAKAFALAKEYKWRGSMAFGVYVTNGGRVRVAVALSGAAGKAKDMTVREMQEVSKLPTIMRPLIRSSDEIILGGGDKGFHAETKLMLTRPVFAVGASREFCLRECVPLLIRKRIMWLSKPAETYGSKQIIETVPGEGAVGNYIGGPYPIWK
jgi:hypothetical protein